MTEQEVRELLANLNNKLGVIGPVLNEHSDSCDLDIDAFEASVDSIVAYTEMVAMIKAAQRSLG